MTDVRSAAARTGRGRAGSLTARRPVAGLRHPRTPWPVARRRGHGDRGLQVPLQAGAPVAEERHGSGHEAAAW